MTKDGGSLVAHQPLGYVLTAQLGNKRGLVTRICPTDTQAVLRRPCWRWKCTRQGVGQPGCQAEEQERIQNAQVSEGTTEARPRAKQNAKPALLPAMHWADGRPPLHQQPRRRSPGPPEAL